MYRAPITVLDKTLPTGRRLVLTYGSGGYTATVGGHVAAHRFTTRVQRDAAADTAPQAPHVFQVPVRPGAVEGMEPAPGQFGAAIELTGPEAEAVESAAEEYRLGPGRRALEAVADPRTWTTPETVLAMEVGTVYRSQSGQAMTVLAVTTRHIPEDGRSFGLDEEEGEMYAHTVREATAEEAAFLEAREAVQRRVSAALERLDEVFAWGDRARPGPDVRPATYEDTTGGEHLHLGGHHPGNLVRHTDRIIAATAGTSILNPSAYWAHPRTPERDEVFNALALDPHTQLH